MLEISEVPEEGGEELERLVLTPMLRALAWTKVGRPAISATGSSARRRPAKLPDGS